MRLLLPVLEILALASTASAYSGSPLHRISVQISASSKRRTTDVSSFSNTRSASSRSTGSRLNAGLRDFVGSYDDDYYGGYGASIRDANYVNDRTPGFGSGGFASGGNTGAFGSGGGGGGGGGGFGRRNSPGFVGFRGGDNYRSDGYYPDYDFAIDVPSRGEFDGTPRGIGGGGGGPYDRGLDSNFINTNGQRRRNRRNIGSRGIGGGRFNDDFDDFDDDVPSIPFVGRRGRRSREGRGRRGGDRGGGLARYGGVPQVYRRDYMDSLDGRSFNQLTAVEQYFEAWNRRNIPLALSTFDDDVYYDDTQFSEPFEGKDKLADHILYVADCLPDSFYFVVDELSVGRDVSRGRTRRGRDFATVSLGRSNVRRFGYRDAINIGALWHVENEYGPLPFARGCSFFKVDPSTNLIVEAYDFPEPAVIKTGGTGIRLLSVANKLTSEPMRWFPFFMWIAYVYVIYFSNGILPGKDIFHADTKTWQEAQDLSFNFMYVAPLANLASATKLNPILESLFNGLLAWAFMFAGFLSDERSGLGPGKIKDARYYERMIMNQEQVLDNGVVLVPPVRITKKNLIGMVSTLVWMQFFLSAAFLPYLFSRTTERYSSEIQLMDDMYGRRSPLPRRIRPLYSEELDRPALVLGEWKGLGVILFGIGLFSLWWGCAGGDVDKFGPAIWVSDKRMVEFMKLLDKDRIASSFVVDLWIFGIFQGWLVEDDWKRRGRSMEEERFLRNVAKFIPFFGLAAYLVFRPKYPSSREEFDYLNFFNERDRARDRSRSRREDYGDYDDRFGGDRFGGFDRFGGGDRFRDRF